MSSSEQQALRRQPIPSSTLDMVLTISEFGGHAPSRRIVKLQRSAHRCERYDIGVQRLPVHFEAR